MVEDARVMYREREPKYKDWWQIWRNLQMQETQNCKMSYYGSLQLITLISFLVNLTNKLLWLQYSVLLFILLCKKGALWFKNDVPLLSVKSPRGREEWNLKTSLTDWQGKSGAVKKYLGWVRTLLNKYVNNRSMYSWV